MKNKLLLALLSVTLGGAAFTANAQDVKPVDRAPEAKMERPMPKNHMGHEHWMKDGKLSREDALKAAGERLDRADKNHDGVLTKDEMREAHKERMEKRMEHREKRRDEGKPTPAQQPAAVGVK